VAWCTEVFDKLASATSTISACTHYTIISHALALALVTLVRGVKVQQKNKNKLSKQTLTQLKNDGELLLERSGILRYQDVLWSQEGQEKGQEAAHWVAYDQLQALITLCVPGQGSWCFGLCQS
jgi:glutamate racemase